jgi:hypothetical protein
MQSFSSSHSKSPLIIQIVIGILASSLLVALFNAFYNDYFKVPYIKSNIVLDDPSHYIIAISNIGLLPAKNITITIASSFSILDYEFFSSENVTLVGRGDNWLSFNGDRFSQGKGGSMKIDLTVNPDKPVFFSQNAPVIVYATYDQGSSKSDESDLRERIFEPIVDDSNYFLYMFIGMTSIIIFIEIIIIRRTINKSEKENVLRYKIDILRIWKLLHEEPEYEKILPLRKRTNASLDAKTFKNMNHYFLVDKFYNKVIERNNLISNGYLEMAKKNNQTIELLAEETLRKINWSDYIRT